MPIHKDTPENPSVEEPYFMEKTDKFAENSDDANQFDNSVGNPAPPDMSDEEANETQDQKREMHESRTLSSH